MYTGKSVHILHIKYLTLVSRWNLFCTLPWMGTCQCEAGAAGTKLAPATPCLSSWGCTCYMSSDHSAHFENTTQWKLQHVNAVHRAVEVTGDLQKKELCRDLVLLLAELEYDTCLSNYQLSQALKHCIEVLCSIEWDQIIFCEKGYFCPCKSV